MNQILRVFLSASCACLVTSCDRATPRDYFDRAMLNTNLISGFAGSGVKQQLKDPSVKLAEGNHTVTMTRKEVVDGMIQSIDEAYGKLKKLKETDDSREMLRASAAVYEYVLPVYRNEYLRLAKLYDEHAGEKEIEALHQSISDQYLAGFKTRMDSLTAAAKPFADAHGIKVMWDVKTSPSY